MCDRMDRAAWPVIHQADTAARRALCGRRPPATLLTIELDAVTCLDCILIDNASRAHVYQHAGPAKTPRNT